MKVMAARICTVNHIVYDVMSRAFTDRDSYNIVQINNITGIFGWLYTTYVEDSQVGRLSYTALYAVHATQLYRVQGFNSTHHACAVR